MPDDFDERSRKQVIDTADDLEERIRKRAHQLWEDEGRPEGRDEDHWNSARALIAAEDDGTRPKSVEPGGTATSKDHKESHRVESPTPETKVDKNRRRRSEKADVS